MTYRTCKNQTVLSDGAANIGMDRRTVRRQTVENDRNGAAKPEGAGAGSSTLPDQSDYLVNDYSSAIISDPTFGTACGAGQWVCGSGIAIAANTATFTTVADGVGLDGVPVVVIGEKYRLSLTVTLSAGELAVACGGVALDTITASGSYQYEFIATATDALTIDGASGPTSGTVTNAALIELI